MAIQCEMCNAEFKNPLQLRTHRKQGCHSAIEPQAPPAPSNNTDCPTIQIVPGEPKIPQIVPVPPPNNSTKPEGNAPDINSPEFKALEAAAREQSAHKFSAQTAQLEHAKKVREQEAVNGAPAVSLMQTICEMLDAREFTGRPGKKYGTTVYNPTDLEYAEAIDQFAGTLETGPLIKNHAYFEQAVQALVDDIAIYYVKSNPEYRVRVTLTCLHIAHM